MGLVGAYDAGGGAGLGQRPRGEGELGYSGTARRSFDARVTRSGWSGPCDQANGTQGERRQGSHSAGQSGV